MPEEAEKDPDNIIEFRQRPENIPWDPKTENLADKKLRSWDVNEHKHGPFLVDEREREVTCKRCGKVLDPIYTILLMVERWHEMDWKLKAYQEADQKAKEAYERRKSRQKTRGGTML